MSAPGTEAPPGARIPSLGRRVAIGILRLVPVMIVLVGVPLGALTFLESHGVSVPISTLQITLGGTALALLGFARYVLRPTRAFGPVSMLGSLVAIVYLLSLVPNASVSIPAGQGSTVTFTYATLFLVLAVIPAIRILSAFVTTVEDWLHPGERLPFDYPT